MCPAGQGVASLDYGALLAPQVHVLYIGHLALALDPLGQSIGSGH